MGILRAATHQEDPNFTKYPGTQSIANAVSAIAMLNLQKSKYWTPHIVNLILKTAEQVHHDMKKLLQGDEILTVAKVCKKITFEEASFTPDIEEFSLIGQMQSSKDEFLDLLPALQEFFREHDACIINAPLTLALWQEEDVYYMYDPNERDKNGLVIIKEYTIGSQTYLTDFTPGYACVTWYKDLKDLVKVYMNNTPRPMRRERFVLSKVEIRDYVEDPLDWNNFRALSVSKWILSGSFAQNNVKFPRHSRNTQCTANAVMAIIFLKLVPLNQWSYATLDEILLEGDQLYNYTVERLKDKDKFVDAMLMVSELPKTFTVMNKTVELEIEDCIINGLITSKDKDEVPNLKKGLAEFFVDNDYAIVTCRNISFAVFKFKEIFYYFDSHSRDESGVIKNYGTSCIIRCLLLDDLIKAIEVNIGPGPSNLYNISRVDVKVFDESDTGGTRRDYGQFQEISEFLAILRSRLSEEDPMFKINAGRQTIANLIMALALTTMYPSYNWTKELVDNLLKMGDKLYDESMDRFYKEGKEEENEYVQEEGEQRGGGRSLYSIKVRGGGVPKKAKKSKEGVIRLRGGGAGRDFESIEDEVISILAGVCHNPDVLRTMETIAKLYPSMIAANQSRIVNAKRSKKECIDFIKKNKIDVKKKSEMNASKNSLASSKLMADPLNFCL